MQAVVKPFISNDGFNETLKVQKNIGSYRDDILSNIEKDNKGVTYLPLYMSMFIDEKMQI